MAQLLQADTIRKVYSIVLTDTQLGAIFGRIISYLNARAEDCGFDYDVHSIFSDTPAAALARLDGTTQIAFVDAYYDRNHETGIYFSRAAKERTPGIKTVGLKGRSPRTEGHSFDSEISYLDTTSSTILRELKRHGLAPHDFVV